MPDFGKYFQQHEFDSPDKPGSGANMQQVLLDKLNVAREFSDTAYRINSGFRSEAHNKAVGGESNSSHCRGFAVDISYKSGSEGYKILEGLMKAGFNRIGVYKSWIHADCDTSLSPKVIWGR